MIVSGRGNTFFVFYSAAILPHPQKGLATVGAETSGVAANLLYLKCIGQVDMGHWYLFDAVGMSATGAGKVDMRGMDMVVCGVVYVAFAEAVATYSATVVNLVQQMVVYQEC